MEKNFAAFHREHSPSYAEKTWSDTFMSYLYLYDYPRYAEKNINWAHGKKIEQ